MDWQQKLSETTERIRNNPNNINLRIEFIQYLCMLGHWERVLQQIGQFQKVFPHQEQQLIIYLLNHVEAELQRLSVFQAKHKPFSFYLDEVTVPILEKQLSLLVLILEKDNAQVSKIYEQLVGYIPENKISINYYQVPNHLLNTNDEWLMDGDIRTAFVCELFADGQYYWQPWHTLKKIQFNYPTTLLDTIWRTAHITLHDGKRLQATIPARYVCFIDESYNDKLLSCAETVWDSLFIERFYTGKGQKLLYGGQAEYPLLDIQTLVFA